ARMHAGEACGTSALRAYRIASPENDITGGKFPAKMAGGLRIRMGNNTVQERATGDRPGKTCFEGASVETLPVFTRDPSGPRLRLFR
ncbi:hypothetical protein, partial [Thiocapsa sp.]|uniref:hypothetical protein n=1 Tax=Thiocapsa sp. TaxID=2024551 RepID=UPI002C164696